MDYEKLKICDFDHWSMYLHPAQYPYPGRAYLALRAKMTYKEWLLSGRAHDDEAAQLQRRWVGVLERLFKQELWPNRVELANDWNQTHIHLIPRWKGGIIEFKGFKFIDPHANELNELGFPKHNYSPYPKKDLKEDLLFEIRDLLKEEFLR